MSVAYNAGPTLFLSFLPPSLFPSIPFSSPLPFRLPISNVIPKQKWQTVFNTAYVQRPLPSREKNSLGSGSPSVQSLCDLWWGNQWLCPPPCQIFMRAASRLFRWSMSVSSVDSKLCFPRWRNAFNSLINPCLGSECLEAQGSDRANYFHAMSTNILGSVSLHVIMRA